ncbi:MAG: radical SAM protein [Chloroflexi bacterium]|nr:radical SAM protein [Chloroflexota bacterium]
MSDRPAEGPDECAPVPARAMAGLDPYQQIVLKMARQHRLLTVHWELTYRCNEECTHCYLDVFAPGEHVAGELNTEQALRCVDEFAVMGALNITFSGGEILARRDFFTIAEYARRKRFAIRLLTNGILVTPDMADRIAALRPTGVEISLYAADAETHDGITRRRRSWELTTRAAQLLRERGLHITIKTPLMRENVHQYHALRALASELGCVSRTDTVITAKDNGGLAPLRHRLTYNDMVWLFREQISETDEIPAPVAEGQRSCSIGLHSLVLDPYGNVFPCVQTRISAGNLLAEPIAEIWQSAVFKETSKLTFDVLPICRTCELNNICHRCHANALVENGSLYLPAASSCREALARRQVLVEKGVLPANYPIPAHLANGVPDDLEYMPVLPVRAAATQLAHLIPADALALVRRPAGMVV